MVDNLNYDKILNLLTAGQGKWEATKKNPHYAINRGSLTEEAKVWFYFFCSVIILTKHLCSVKDHEAMILYAMLKGYKMNVGRLIEGSIKGYHLSNMRGLIPHLATITRLCILAGVKGSWEEEEQCPQVSPLTLTRVIKGPRNKKQKGLIEAEAEPAEENEAREMEAILEDIPPTVTEDILSGMIPLSHSYPEQAEISRRNEVSAEIMEMLKSMKKDMEEMEQKWEKWQHIREEFQEAEFRRKEHMWEQNMKQREEEWKEELKRREEKANEKMKASLEAFYNNQFKRDAELLTILRKKEAEMEGNMLKNIEAFKYLYKERFKEFERLMKERDKQLEDNDAYRKKIWLESLDLINQNLSKLLECISELERIVNQMGLKQDTLITAVELTSDIYLTGREIPPAEEKKRSEMTFTKFDPSLASLDVDPPNVIPPMAYKRRK